MFKTASSPAVSEPVKIKWGRCCRFGPPVSHSTSVVLSCLCWPLLRVKWLFLCVCVEHVCVWNMCRINKVRCVISTRKKGRKQRKQGFDSPVWVWYYWYWLFYLHDSVTKKSCRSLEGCFGAHLSVCRILLNEMGLSWLEPGPPVLSPMHAD